MSVLSGGRIGFDPPTGLSWRDDKAEAGTSAFAGAIVVV